MNEQNLYNYLKRLKEENFINEKIYKEVIDNYENLDILTDNSEFIKQVKQDNRDIKTVENFYRPLISFTLLTEEYIKEIILLCKKYNIKNIIEVFGGTGIFSYYINKYSNGEINCISYTTKKDKYFVENNKIRLKMKNLGFLKEVENHQEFYDIIKNYEYDMIIANWIPYKLEDSYKIIDNLKKDKFLFVTTEGEGGCIADDKFHFKLDELKLIHIFENKVNFPFLYDKSYLYKKL